MWRTDECCIAPMAALRKKIDDGEDISKKGVVQKEKMVYYLLMVV